MLITFPFRFDDAASGKAMPIIICNIWIVAVSGNVKLSWSDFPNNLEQIMGFFCPIINNQ